MEKKENFLGSGSKFVQPQQQDLHCLDSSSRTALRDGCAVASPLASSLLGCFSADFGYPTPHAQDPGNQCPGERMAAKKTTWVL